MEVNSVRNRERKIHDLKLTTSNFRDNQKKSFIHSTIDTVNSTIETNWRERLEADKDRDKLRL